MKKEKIFIFDLDHTLLDSRSLREKLSFFIGQDNSMTSEEIWSYFNLNQQTLTEFMKDILPDLLFSQTLELLPKIMGERVLLTYGEEKFQKCKVDSLNLKKYFSRIFITQEEKIFFLKNFVKDHHKNEIFFINDIHNKRFKENQDITQSIPKINVIGIDNYHSNTEKHINVVLKKILS